MLERKNTTKWSANN